MSREQDSGNGNEKKNNGTVRKVITYLSIATAAIVIWNFISGTLGMSYKKDFELDSTKKQLEQIYEKMQRQETEIMAIKLENAAFKASIEQKLINLEISLNKINETLNNIKFMR